MLRKRPQVLGADLNRSEADLSLISNAFFGQSYKIRLPGARARIGQPCWSVQSVWSVVFLSLSI